MTKKQNKYASLGGIEKAFDLYISGKMTVSAISEKVNLSKASISNHFIAYFGIDAVESGRGQLWKAAKKKKRISDILSGKSVKLTYEEAIDCLMNKEIKQQGYLPLFETVVKISQKFVGKPARVWFGDFALTRIDGNKGSVKIRYAEPIKETAEYAIDRYRFKITPSQFKSFDAGLFCIRNGLSISYYLFPSKELLTIQSLNLKFDNHQTSKYANFLVKMDY